MFSRGGGGRFNRRQGRDNFNRRYQRSGENQDYSHYHSLDEPNQQNYSGFYGQQDLYDNKRQRFTGSRDYHDRPHGSYDSDRAGPSIPRERPKKERPPPHLRGKALVNSQEYGEGHSWMDDREQRGQRLRTDQINERLYQNSDQYQDTDRYSYHREDMANLGQLELYEHEHRERYGSDRVYYERSPENHDNRTTFWENFRQDDHYSSEENSVVNNQYDQLYRNEQWEKNKSYCNRRGDIKDSNFRSDPNDFSEEPFTKENIVFSDDELPSDSDSESQSEPELRVPSRPRKTNKRRKKYKKFCATNLPMSLTRFEIIGNLRQLGFKVKNVERRRNMSIFYIVLFNTANVSDIINLKYLVGHPVKILFLQKFFKIHFQSKARQEQIKSGLNPQKSLDDSRQEENTKASNSEGNNSCQGHFDDGTGRTSQTNSAGGPSSKRKKKVKLLRIFIENLPMSYLKEDLNAELTKLGFRVRFVNRNSGLKVFHVQLTPTANVMDVFNVTTLGGFNVKVIEPKLICKKPKFVNQALKQYRRLGK